MNYLKPEMGWQPEWDKLGDVRIEVDAFYLKKLLARQLILDRVIVFGKKLGEGPHPEDRARIQAKYDEAVADAWALDTRPPKFPVDDTSVASIRDLSMMIRRLANKVHRVDATDPIIHQAFDLVERKGTKATVLRQLPEDSL